MQDIYEDVIGLVRKIDLVGEFKNKCVRLFITHSLSLAHSPSLSLSSRGSPMSRGESAANDLPHIPAVLVLVVWVITCLYINQTHETRLTSVLIRFGCRCRHCSTTAGF